MVVSSIVGFMPGAAYEDPYPFHLLADGDGFMLGRANEGDSEFVTQRPQDLSRVSPQTYNLTAQNPVFGATQAYNNLFYGMGRSIQREAVVEEPHYHYTLNADLSHSHGWIKGPDIQNAAPSPAPAAGNFPRYGFEAGGKLFAAGGRYIWKITGASTSVQVVDLGAGIVVSDVFHYKNTFGEYVLIGCGHGVMMRRFDPAAETAATHASLEGQSFAKVGEQVFRAQGTNQVAIADIDADLWLAASWSAANQFVVGDTTAAIVSMEQHPAGALIIFKADGPYTLGPDGDYISLYPDYGFAPSTENGTVRGVFLNDLYANFQEGLQKIDRSYILHGAGPEEQQEGDSPVQGMITAFCAHGSYRAYAGLRNPDTGTGYLIALGGWSEDPQTGRTARLLAWHGSLSPAYSGRYITMLFRSAQNAPSNHQRLYVGFSDGAIGSFILPHSANPAACSEYRYATSQGLVRLPRFRGPFFSEDHALYGFTLAGDLSPADYAQVQYRKNPAEPFELLNSNFDSPVEEVEVDDEVLVRGLDIEILLNSASSSSTPVVQNVGMEFRTVADQKMVYEFYVMAYNGMRRSDGTYYYLGQQEIVDKVRGFLRRASVPCVIPGGESQDLAWIDYDDVQAYDEPFGRKRRALKIMAVQRSLNIVYGAISRLGGRTIGSYAGITIAQGGLI